LPNNPGNDPPIPSTVPSYSEEDLSQRDLRHYLQVLRRRVRVIAGMTILVTLLALIFSVLQSNVYRASAQVLLNRQNLPAAVTGRTVDGTVSEDPARVAMTQAALARSPAVAARAVKAARVAGVSSQDLLSSSSVTPNPSADILVFSVDNGNSGNAAKLANAYALAYRGYKLQLDTNALQRARNELNARLAKLRAHGDHSSVLYRAIVSSEQQLHTMQLLQSEDSVLSTQSAGNQIKPTPKRNALLGFGFGLLLGCGAAFLLEALDKRVREEAEVERELGLPLLARVPEPPRRLRHLTMLGAPASAQADAVRRLATNVEFSSPDRPLQTLMITSAVQREGKSTTAGNLAVALARAGKLVVLLDLDLRQPSVASLFHVRVPTGLTNVIVGKASIDDALIQIPLPPLEPSANGSPQLLGGSLSVMPTGMLPANPGEFVKANALQARVLEPLRKRFDYIIIDAPPMCIGGDALTLSASADSLIVVTRLGIIDRAALRDLKRQLATSPTPAIGFVLTGVEAPDGYGYGYGTTPPESRGLRYARRLLPAAVEVAEKARRVRF
jgi:succinoglycan biosynthesis transport protein ExoP